MTPREAETLGRTVLEFKVENEIVFTYDVKHKLSDRNVPTMDSSGNIHLHNTV